MKEITAALIKARKNFKPLVFDRDGARNGYATYGAIKHSVEDALAHEGMNIHFEPDLVAGARIVRMVIAHAPSGEMIRGAQELIDDPNSPIKDANQRYGSALTYAMRNLARALLGLHAEDGDLDDYGDAPKAAQASEKQVKFLLGLLHAKGDAQKDFTDRIMKKYNVGNLYDLSARDASEVIEALTKK